MYVSWRKKAQVSAIMVASALMLAACSTGAGGEGTDTGTSPSATGDSPVSGGNLTLATLIEPPSYDPARCYMAVFQACHAVFGSLIEYDPATNEITPAMAESVETEDGKSWTVRLRDGLTFSDGTAYDADAVVYNWDRLADPVNLAQGSARLSESTWRAVDPLTVELVLPAVDFGFPSSLQFDLGLIGSPAAFDSLGDGFGAAPVGAGAFLLENWVQGSEVTLARNPDYWEEGRPYLDSLTVQLITNDTQRADALRAGSVNATPLTEPLAAQELKDEGYATYSLAQTGGNGVGFNLTDEAISDDDLRGALLESLDAAQINQVARHLDAATAFLPPDNPFRDDALGVYPEKDLASAQKQLDAYLKRSGQSSVEISLLTQAGVPSLVKPAELLQAQWGELEGLTIKVESFDSATLRGLQRAGDYQIVVWTAGGGPSLNKMYDLFHTDGVENYQGYSNPDVDAALDVVKSSNDPEEIAEAFATVNGQVSLDAPIRTWTHRIGLFAAAEDVEGVEPMTGLGTPYFDNLWISE